MALNSDSRTINATKNAASAIINKIAILLLTFFSRKLFIYYIGVEYLGINGLFSNILTLLSVADLGIGTAMNVSLYKPIAQNDTVKLCAYMNYFKKLYHIIAIAVTVIGLGLIPFLPYIINLENSIDHIYLFYIIFVLKNTISYLFVYKSSIIIADQKNYIVSNIDLYINLFRVIIQTVSIVLFKNYFIYIIIELLSVIIRNIWLSIIADNQYPFIKDNNDLSKKEKKEFFKDIYAAFLYRIGGSILAGTDNIIISIMIGTTAVGLYSNYYTITYTIETFIILLFSSLTAGIGNLIAKSEKEKRYSIYKSMQLVGNWLGAIVTICIFFLIQDFIVIWLGEEMKMDSYVLIAITINMYYTICMRPVWTFREGTGMYRQIKYIMFITAIVNIILSILFGYLWGVGGILVATAVAKFTTCFWFEPNILFKQFFFIKPFKYYLAYLENVLVTLLCGIICYFPMKLLSEINIFIWLLKALICCVVVCVVYFIRYHKTPEFANIKEKAVLLVKRKRK